MSISNYTPSTCEYKRSQLKDVVYLLTEEDYNRLKISSGMVYNLANTTPIALSCHNVEFTEEETLDERYKFTKTLKFAMNGYNNIDTLNGGLYAIIFTTEGGSFLVNSEFPPKITYNYNLSDTQDETQFTLYSQSNIPSVEVLPSIEPTISIDCEYKGYGIDTIKFADKDYASLNENTNTITLYDGATVKDVEWLEGSCSFQESFDGERVIDTITFDIDMDIWDSTWHLKLLEFNKNIYSAIVTPKYHSSKFIVGFNFGLQASYSTYATNENGQNNKITITLKETSKNGVHIAQSVSYATNSEKSWQYVQKVLADGNYEVDTYECVDTNIARYIVQEEVDSSNNPTGRYKVFSGYSGSFGDLLNVVGTFNEDVRFFTTKCSWKSKQIDYRWVVVPNDYICSGGNKMTKEKGQQSVDGGAWEDTNPLQIRAVLPILEEESPDCGCLVRWVEDPDGYVCSGSTKMTMEKKQVSSGYGCRWKDSNPLETRGGSPIEYGSGDCGFVPRRPPEGLLYKYWGYSENQPIGQETLRTYDNPWSIDGHYEVFKKDTEVNADEFNDDIYGYIGNHVSVAESLSFMGYQGCTYWGIEIPNSVISLSNFLWAGSHIKKLNLPNTLLHFNLFEDNDVISEVTLPETLLEAPSFYNCPRLTTLTIPKNVASFDRRMLGGSFQSLHFKSIIPPKCELTSVPSGITFPIFVPTMSVELYRNAFSGVIDTNRIQGGESTDDTYSDNYKFRLEFEGGSANTYDIDNAYLDIGLTPMNVSAISITISDTVKVVTHSSGRLDNVTYFKSGRNVKSITDLYLPKAETIILNEGLLELGQFLYYNTKITTLTLPSSLIYIGDRAFQGSKIQYITIPNNVKHIGWRAFKECTSLTTITIPSSVISIETESFARCTSLASVTFGNGNKHIGSFAFSGCTSLGSVTIPSSVEFIGDGAFYGCSNLSSITILATTPPEMGSGAYHGTGYQYPIPCAFDGSNCPIYVPCASVTAYQSANYWRKYASRIEGIPPCEPPVPPVGYKWVATYSDSHTDSASCDLTSAITRNEISLSNLVEVTIGQCVTSISQNTFYKCSSLTSIDIPNSVTSIGNGAFEYCSDLTSVTIPDSVTSIGINAFAYCSGLTSCTIGSGVTSIGSSAFVLCSGLTSVDIPSGVTSIGNYAFAGCSSLTGITVNATTPPALGTDAFEETNNCPIYVPSGSVNSYKTKATWNYYASRIQAIP